MIGPLGNGTYNSAWTDSINKAVQQGRWRIITPSALVLAQIAKEEEFKVDIVDEEFRTVSTEQDYDIVCIYTVTPNAYRAYEYASHFRKKGVWVVIGGVHSFFKKSEAKQYCDTLLLGEGELIMRHFLKDYLKGYPKEEYIQETGSVKLNDSPTPLYSFLNKAEQRLIPIQTARGCSHCCSFCNVRGLYGSNFRTKSYKQIQTELLEIKKLKWSKVIYVTDDNIYSTMNHFLLLCKLFQKHNYTWYANTDISFADDEKNIKLAYKSGLRQVLIGLESIDVNNLYRLDKDNFKYQYLRKYKEYINIIQTNGIGVIGSFIIGQMHDTHDTFRYLEEFIYETRIYGANITMSTPYPGTALFFQMQKENRITTYNWNHYTIFQPIIRIDSMSKEQLNEAYIRLLRNVNSNEFIQNKLLFFKNHLKDYQYEI